MYVAWTQDQKDEGSALPPEPSWTCAPGLCGADGAASVCGGGFWHGVGLWTFLLYSSRNPCSQGALCICCLFKLNL